MRHHLAAVALHGYQPEDIRLAGTPQWDPYFQNDVLTTREEFCRRIGADPSQKLITLTTTPLELYAYYEQLIEQLVAARNNGRWPHAAPRHRHPGCSVPAHSCRR